MQKIHLQSQFGNEFFTIDLSRIYAFKRHKNWLGLNHMRFEFDTDADAETVYKTVANMVSSENADKKGIRVIPWRYKSMMFCGTY